GGLIRTVVEHHRRAHTLPAITVDGRDVRSRYAVMLEMLIEGRNAHCEHTFCHKVADRIIDHSGRQTGFQTKTVGKVGGDVEFASAYVDFALGSLAKRNDPWVQAMNQA